MSKDVGIPGLDEDKSYGKCWTKLRLLLKQEYKCAFCGKPFRDPVEGWYFMTIDHWQSKKHQGTDAFSNLRLACKSCNSAKGEQELEPDQGESLFREEMRRAREVTERVIQQRMRVSKSLLAARKKAEDLGTPGDLARELYGMLSKPPCDKEFSEATCPSRRGGGHDKVNFEHGGRDWQLDASDFILEAISVGESQYTAYREQLECAGFFLWRTGRKHPYKHLKPFFDAAEGVKLIRQEVEAVELVLGRPPQGGSTGVCA